MSSEVAWNSAWPGAGLLSQLGVYAFTLDMIADGGGWLGDDAQRRPFVRWGKNNASKENGAFPDAEPSGCLEYDRKKGKRRGGC